jgi:hypothetical protein
MCNTLSVVSKPNVHKTYGERLGVGEKKGEIALGAVIYYAQRTADVLTARIRLTNCSLVIAGNSLLLVLGLSTKAIGLLFIFFDLYNQLQNTFTAR